MWGGDLKLKGIAMTWSYKVAYNQFLTLTLILMAQFTH